MPKSQPQFSLDFSLYDGSQATVTKKTFATRFPVTMSMLTPRNLLPGIEELVKGRVSRGLSKHFIRYGKTTNLEAEAFLNKYEMWTIKNTLNDTGLKGQKIQQFYERVISQPTGVEDPPHEDALCYTTENVLGVASAPASAVVAPSRSSTLRSATTATAAGGTSGAIAPAPAPTVTSVLK